MSPRTPLSSLGVVATGSLFSSGVHRGTGSVGGGLVVPPPGLLPLPGLPLPGGWLPGLPVPGLPLPAVPPGPPLQRPLYRLELANRPRSPALAAFLAAMDQRET